MQCLKESYELADLTTDGVILLRQHHQPLIQQPMQYKLVLKKLKLKRDQDVSQVAQKFHLLAQKSS
tara:strand:- start:30 stop:227 length:198 start_codon:yes stop_codon:yes gene_type:complete